MITYLRHRIRAERGESGSILIPVLGFFLVLGSYLMFPDTFHGFFHWLFDQFFTALHEAFGTEPKKGATGTGGKQ